MNNYPIWKDTIYTSASTEYDLEEKKDGVWAVAEHHRCTIMPDKTQIEVCVNKIVEANIKSEMPSTGITEHKEAYRQYRIGDNEYGFIQDWSYEDWDGSDRVLSAPINRRIDPRMRVLYTQFSQNGGTIEVDKKHIEEPYIRCSPSSHTGLGDAETFEIAIESNDTWYAVQKPDWATITPESGRGNAVVNVTLTRNDTGSARGSNIVFYALKGASAQCALSQRVPEPKPSNSEVWYKRTTNNIYPSDTTSAYGDKVAPHTYTSAFSKPYSYYPNAFSEMGTVITSNIYNSTTGYAIWTLNGDATRVAAKAFMGCRTLKEIYLPDTVETIGELAFASNSPTDDRFGALDTIVMPDTITEIGYSAFSHCGFKSFRFPLALTIITSSVLYFNISLVSVDIPASITDINMCAFAGCRSLTTINYAGTIAQWGMITKGQNWNESVPATVVHCSDGDVAI